MEEMSLGFVIYRLALKVSLISNHSYRAIVMLYLYIFVDHLTTINVAANGLSGRLGLQELDVWRIWSIGI